MPKRNLLLIAAVAGLAGFLCMLAGVSLSFGVVDSGRMERMDPGGARRTAVEESMQAILPAETDSADSPILAEAVEKLLEEQYVVWVWVADSGGVIRLARNGPARAGEDVRSLSAYDQDLIFAVEPEVLDPVAEMELRLAMALRREGEHNDIFGHTVRAVPGPDGEPAAFVGVTFEAVDANPGPLDILLITAGAIGFLLYWFGLPLWTALDARAGGQGRAALLWGLFVLVANAAGLIAYLLVRNRSPNGKV
jgi:hypothetical protein